MSSVRALAFIYAYNEGDIIGAVLRHLLDQGVDVHVSDNWSTDETGLIVEALHRQYPARVTVERYPAASAVEQVSWFEMLKRVEAMAKAARRRGYLWMLHHDADEIRRSARPGERLVDAISRISRGGYNAIDHDVLVYQPCLSGFSGEMDPEAVLTERISEHIDQKNGQVKCWNQPPGISVELARSGGHRVRFYGIRVAPERLILKHYPLRSPEQAERKLRERASRWAQSDRDRGFHTQYLPDQLARFAHPIVSA